MSNLVRILSCDEATVMAVQFVSCRECMLKENLLQVLIDWRAGHVTQKHFKVLLRCDFLVFYQFCTMCDCFDFNSYSVLLPCLFRCCHNVLVLRFRSSCTWHHAAASWLPTFRNCNPMSKHLILLLLHTSGLILSRFMMRSKVSKADLLFLYLHLLVNMERREQG